MKIVFITGSHPRHSFMARVLASTGMLSHLVVEDRGAHVPEPPKGLDSATEQLYRLHFARRTAAEHDLLGAASWPEVPSKKIAPEELNGEAVRHLIKAEAPGLLLTYGCHKLDDTTLSAAPSERWNIHGGLSPWYRGAITHFWPSYMLEPQMTGMTVHELTTQLDAGPIVHQCVADLVRGDGLQELACRAVLKLGFELPSLLEMFCAGEPVLKKANKTTGKLWLAKDWRPEHLRVIYEFFDDDIVDAYLDGHLCNYAPNFHRQF